MQYPEDFPPESRAAVTAERLRAGREFDRLRENGPQEGGVDLEAELRRYILRQFGVFAREACRLGLRGIWHVNQVEEAAVEFLGRAAIDAVYGKDHDKNGRKSGEKWFSEWDGSIEPAVRRQLEQSDEWKQFQATLLQVAESQAARGAEVSGDQEGQIGKLTLYSTDPGPFAEKKRSGYRSEVRKWMARENLTTLAEAAKRLGISLSALKSIMSDQGKRRYSEETLSRILAIIIPDAG